MNFNVKVKGVAGLKAFGDSVSGHHNVAVVGGFAKELASSALQGEVVVPFVVAEAKSEATVQSGMISKPMAPR